MRLAFLGSPDFAVPALSALHAAGHEIAAVYCQPPRPAGRGHRETKCPVQRTAEALGLPVRTPARLRHAAEEHAAFAALGLDAAVVAAYGLILPKPMLEAPRRGCLNIHASLLPRWRGAAPIQRALLAGDAETGITIMQMDEGLDTGPILEQRRIPIGAQDDAQTLHDRLAALGAEMIVRTLADIAAGRARAVPQPSEGVSYAPKIAKEETVIDWSEPCAQIERRIRALRPAPGARTLLRGEPLKLWRAECVDASGASGTVLVAADALVIACGQGALAVRELQLAGGRRLAAAEFLRGHPLAAGERLGAAR